ncbi:uncharacterized protein LOC128931523 [Callithrix jacchus]|uniref:uncharacterized protein LOC128931523 n=1 Tax=Callithrix jacchus TaxID=9483 RepID=UPI0023DD3DEF|nr:uncharacterized protein LOC128931523 [Callithrix jacchus]
MFPAGTRMFPAETRMFPSPSPRMQITAWRLGGGGAQVCGSPLAGGGRSATAARRPHGRTARRPRGYPAADRAGEEPASSPVAPLLPELRRRAQLHGPPGSTGTLGGGPHSPLLLIAGQASPAGAPSTEDPLAPESWGQASTWVTEQATTLTQAAPSQEGRASWAEPPLPDLVVGTAPVPRGSTRRGTR